VFEVAFAETSELKDQTLCLATSDAHLFEGRFTSPTRAADFLLALSQVVSSRFYTPPAMVARLIAESDPVVTCSRHHIRWEGFSSCCSVYARVDMTQQALEGSLIAPGTTNVDFGPKLRAALARARNLPRCELAVGRDYVEVTAEERVVEKRVKLPRRWLQGFIEAQYHQLSMTPFAELSTHQFRRFVQSLPSSDSRQKGCLHKSGRGLRLAFQALDGTIPLQGWQRLKVLHRLLHHCERVRVSSNAGEATAWQVVSADTTFTLLLSPVPSRGFSGEGQALYALSFERDETLESELMIALGWESTKTVKELAHQCQRTPSQVETSLACLSALGRVGFELATEGFFRRDLPFETPEIETLHPRLKAARNLLDSVSFDGGRALVRSKGTVYVVDWSGQEASCNCPWFSRHAQERGPCKHILAAQWSLRTE
jgi:SWIM zinc finger